jgi:anti-sigma28 factor (negative regulator of flagellin synthesis)
VSHDPEDDPDAEDQGELEALYSPGYLRDCADGEAREERLQELRRRIALRMYDVDATSIADGLLSRGDLGDE